MLSDSTVAAVYDRRWLTTPALIETPLQVRTPRRPYHLLRFSSFALPRGACSGASMTAGRCIVLAKHIFQPRIARIFTNGKRLRRRLSSPVLFVVQGHPGRMGFGRLTIGVVPVSGLRLPGLKFGSCGTMTQGFRLALRARYWMTTLARRALAALARKEPPLFRTTWEMPARTPAGGWL